MDPLVSPSAPGIHWTTVNVGEAVAGVQTPLSWTFFEEAAEAASREGGFAVGALTRAERKLPTDLNDRIVRVFYGHSAIQVQIVATLGDRLPGTTGEEAVSSLLGHVPPDLEFRPTKRRYPVVAWRLPKTFLTIPGRVPGHLAEYEAWRVSRLARVPELDYDGLAAQLREARDRMTAGVAFQTIVLFAVVQPLFDGLSRLVADAGTGDVSILSGTGGAELAVISDIWEASRGRMTVEEVVAKHGFHGPEEGELSSTVWREDDTPLRKMIEQYAGRDESDAPGAAGARRDEEADEQQRAVLAALPAPKRPGARLLLRLARKRITLRGHAKRSFLGVFDVGRATARRMGEMLAADGRIERPEDVFQLTLDELTLGLPADAAALAAERRERYARYRDLDLPGDWRGLPEPVSREDAARDGARERIDGIGVSEGVVEGVVRVVEDPAFAEVEADEVLVAPITDPSWSSIMFISSALVVDVGGALSHAAVVARELGIPCVVNTGDGTRALRTGDRVRVDGKAGTIEILARAQTA